MATIQVKVELVTDDETGEKYILPSQSHLDIQKKQAQELLKEAEELSKSKRREDKANATKKRDAGQWLLDGVNRLENARTVLKDKAVVTTYSLVEPTYGEYLECEREATEDNDGNPYVNQQKLLSELLRISYQGDVKSLPVNVAKLLETRVYNLVNPNMSNLPFLS